MEIGAKTVLLTCAPIIAGSLFFFVALHFWCAGRELRDHGVTAQATVATKFRKGGGIENYYAIFAFTDLDGRPQKVEVRVLSRAWHMLREGGTEAIAYLPSQPEKAQLGPKWGKQLVGSVLLFLALGGSRGRYSAWSS